MRLYKVVLPAAAAAALLSLNTGCATSSDVEQLQRQVSSVDAEVGSVKGNISDLDAVMESEARRGKEIQAEIKAISDSQAKMSGTLKALGDDLAVVKRNQADLGSRMFTMEGGQITGFAGKLDEVKHGLETTNAKLDDIKAALLARMAEIEEAGKTAQPRGGAVFGQATSAGAQATPLIADPTQLYQSAYLDYTKGNYDVALTEFRQYMKSFPDGEFVGNAQYWIGESLYSLGRYEEAGAEFDKVIKNHPDSPKVPGAILKQGFCYDALKRPGEARAAYELVIKKYPDSEAARLAAEKLRPKKRGKIEK